jgi:hypothetical protein
LATDLDRVVATQPSLVAAAWTSDSYPRAGATIHVEIDARYSIPLARRAFGSSSGTVTLTSWDPPGSTTAVFRSPSILAQVLVRLGEANGGTTVNVTGWAKPVARWATVAIGPISPVLAWLATRAIVRVIRRIDDSAAGPQSTPSVL